MTRARNVWLLALSTVLSVGLAVVVNVATGGSLPGNLARVQWFAWPLVGVLALALIAVSVWQTDEAERASTDELTRPAELPPDPVRFAGRQSELDALLSAVPRRPRGGLGSPVVLGIFGAGGMGKTVLATRLAHLVAARYPDGHVFVELRGASLDPVDAAEVLRRVLYAFGVSPGDVPEDLVERQALYRTVLAERRVLLYLDDASNEDQISPLLPAAEGCLVLITARRSLVGVGLTTWCDLDVLSEPEALALLGAISGDEPRMRAEPAAAAEVIRYCGSLPLALAIAGARLRSRPHWSLAGLSRRLADEHHRLDELQVGSHDVRASIGLSYADLDAVERRLFRRLSLLGYATFGPGVAAALLGGKDHWPLSDSVLERLADAKLLEPAGDNRYRLHDLVRLFAQEKLAAEERPKARKAALLRSLTYYLERTQDQWRYVAEQSTSADRRAEAERWFTRSRSAIVAAVQRAADNDEKDIVRQLTAAVAPYLESHFYPVDLAAVARIAAQTARAADDQAALATALRDLGVAERQRSRHGEAVAALTESLALWEELGRDGPAAEVLHRLGDAYREVGRLEDAEDVYLRSITIFNDLEQSRDAAVVKLALGLTWLLTGKVDDATDLIEAAADHIGVDDPDAELDAAAAWAVEHLGAVHGAANRPDVARSYHERSLASFRSRGERYGSAYALLNLGRCASALGRTEEARRHYAESMRLFTEIGNADGQRTVNQALDQLPGLADKLTAWP